MKSPALMRGWDPLNYLSKRRRFRRVNGDDRSPLTGFPAPIGQMGPIKRTKTRDTKPNTTTIGNHGNVSPICSGFYEQIKIFFGALRFSLDATLALWHMLCRKQNGSASRATTNRA